MNKSIFSLLIAAIIMESCNLPSSSNNSIHDTRPKSQIDFNNRVDSLTNNLSGNNNSVKADAEIDSFNNYALKDLKKIKDWQVIVNEITDNPNDASSFAKGMMDLTQPIYNLKMYSIIRMHDKINPTLDSLNIPQGDVVFITYTTPKEIQENGNQKNILNTIKTVNNFDTLLISGSITHIDENLKVDFRDLIKSGSTWNVDLLATDIKKKK